MTIVLNGFTCPACGGWTGTEKEPLAECRACGTPREPTMRRVVLESPYAAPVKEGVEANIRFARACVRDCLKRGDAPIVSHLLFTQPGILRDEVPEERSLGMRAEFAWTAVAEAVVVYTDRGISRGMKAGIAVAEKHKIPVEYRTLGEPTTDEVSPGDLTDLLSRVGLRTDAETLMTLATCVDDVVAAAQWARTSIAHTEDQSSTPPPPMPAWLEPLTPIRKEETPQ